MKENAIEIENILIAKGIRPTSNRVLVYRELAESSHPVGLLDLEASLSPMDKGSIFRVLDLFAEKDLVHIIEDGSRSSKYELCHNQSGHNHRDQHIHFFCENCKDTYCFEDIPVPEVKIPSGFRIHSVNYVLKGRCPKCDKE